MALNLTEFKIKASVAGQGEVDKLTASLGKTDSVIAKLGSGFQGFGAALGLGSAAAFAGLAAIARGAINSADALNDVADATGSTIEKISALENLGLRTGTSLDTVSGTLVKFNQVLNGADGNNGAAQALRAIGLSAEELKRLDPAEALRQTAVALSGFADDGNKARLTQELFGKSVREAAPFLKDLAEAGELNATVTAEQAAQAERFNKIIFQLNTGFSNLSRTITLETVSAFADLGDVMREGEKAGEGLFKTLLRQTELAGFLGLSEATTGYRAARQELDLVTKALESGNLSLARRNTLTQRQAELQSEVNRSLALEYGRAGGGTTARSTVERPSITGLAPTTSRAALSSVGRAPESEAEKLEREYQKALADGDEVLAARFERIAAQRDAEQRGLEATAERWRDIAEPQRAYLRQIEEIRSLTERGLLSESESGAAIANVQKQIEALGELKDSGRETFDELKNAVEGWGRSATDAFVDFAFTGKASFGDMVSSMLKDLARMQIQKNVMGPIFGSIGGGSGGSGGFGGILSSIGSIFGFAKGGDHRGGLRIVGENGPELEATGPSRIFNVDQTRRILSGGSGGGATVNNTTIHVHADGSTSTDGDAGQNAKLLGQRMAAAARQVLVEESRPGGLLSPV